MFRHFRRCVGKPRVHTEEKEKFTAENKRNLTENKRNLKQKTIDSWQTTTRNTIFKW